MSDTTGGEHQWLIGVGVYGVGSIIINLGTNLMKFSHVRNEKKARADRKKAYLQPYWQLGMVIFVIGNILNFVAFSFAAQTLLAAVGSIQFVSNLLFAWMVLHERITRRAVAATGLIVTGNVVIVIFGSHETQNLTYHDLLESYFELPFLLYITVVILVVVIIHLCYKLVKGLIDEKTISPSSGWALKFQPAAYAAVSAMIGAQSVLLGKSCSELIHTSIAKGAFQFFNLFSWFLLGSFVLITIFWMIRMNTALRKFPAMYIVPALQVIWIVFSILGGGIYFKEFQTFSSLQYLMFGIGVVTILAGVYFLAPRQNAASGGYTDLEAPEGTPKPHVTGARRRRRAGSNASPRGSPSRMPASPPHVSADGVHLAVPEVELPAPVVNLSGRGRKGSQSDRYDELEDISLDDEVEDVDSGDMLADVSSSVDEVDHDDQTNPLFAKALAAVADVFATATTMPGLRPYAADSSEEDDEDYEDDEVEEIEMEVSDHTTIDLAAAMDDPSPLEVLSRVRGIANSPSEDHLLTVDTSDTEGEHIEMVEVELNGVDRVSTGTHPMSTWDDDFGVASEEDDEEDEL
eukprot:TRINITY_DN3197_c0_g3_i1.p1 TRINITY_DN3197_c0_g3~~TRINITY_DN3197_c0_g3_i1.p1  ORF type:complete len:575 (+),score=94.13 TRINITY_DN3197_c0_g3_i1:222-1946(+)